MGWVAIEHYWGRFGHTHFVCFSVQNRLWMFLGFAVHYVVRSSILLSVTARLQLAIERDMVYVE